MTRKIGRLRSDGWHRPALLNTRESTRFVIPSVSVSQFENKPGKGSGRHNNPNKNDPGDNNSNKDKIKTNGPHGAATEATVLLQFDLTGLGTVVNSAELQMINGAEYSQNHVTAVHALTTANSGWSGAESNWNFAHATNAQRWAGDTGGDGGDDGGASISGTDYTAAAMGTLSYTANSPANSAHIATLDQATVQGWLSDPSTNNGMILVWSSGQADFEWWSHEADNAAYRPVLRLDFDNSEIILLEFGARLFLEYGDLLHLQ